MLTVFHHQSKIKSIESLSRFTHLAQDLPQPRARKRVCVRLRQGKPQYVCSAGIKYSQASLKKHVSDVTQILKKWQT